MRYLILLLLLAMSCHGLSPDEICGTEELNDILGTWYTTSQEPGPIPGYYRTDSTIWILDRAKLDKGLTSMDSLRVTIEHHPGGESFDPTKHSQRTITLAYNLNGSEHGEYLMYGAAKFEIPECDSLIITWIDGTTHRLRRK